ncbi:effector binding domain-containing protein [Candidatus Bathyarchaeota archaeon]|nr:effector binding domain-containing protein [Candidatus Bathyarchaeota archaeon]
MFESEIQTRQILRRDNEKIAKIFNSIGEKHRLLILSELLEGTIEYKKLLEITGLSKTALSHHLSILCKNKLINQITRGSYRLSEDGHNLLISLTDSYIVSDWKKSRESERRIELIRNIYKSEGKMKEDYKIVELPVMKVACFRAISETPEHDSINKLADWVKHKVYMSDMDKHPIYGFDRPDLTKNEKIRAYEIWVKVDFDEEEEEDIEYKIIPPSKYVTTICKTGGDPFGTIPYAWKKLDDWVKSKGYKMGAAQCLEQHHTPGTSDDFTLTLFYPITI